MTVDLVFCIDATGAMGSVWGSLPYDIPAAIEAARARLLAEGIASPTFRVKLVGYRDFAVDSEPLFESCVFDAPDEYESLFAFTGGVWAHGGGDLPEDGLEALAFALRAEFPEAADHCRIITFVTDSPTHPLGSHADSPWYPEDMPHTVDEIRAQVEGDRRCRLILLAPEVESWDTVRCWKNTFSSRMDVGWSLEEVSYASLLAEVLASVPLA